MPNILPLVINSLATYAGDPGLQLAPGNRGGLDAGAERSAGTADGRKHHRGAALSAALLAGQRLAGRLRAEGWYSTHGGGQPWLSGWNAAVWVHTLAAIPWVVLFAGLGLRTVEPALEEQALLDGTPWQVFRRVTLPACWPALGLAAVWVAMFTAGEMTVTSIFSVRTYAEEVYSQIVTHDDAAGAMTALLPGIVGTSAPGARHVLLRPAGPP